jgi:putative hydrolase of the HAD superfamily
MTRPIELVLFDIGGVLGTNAWDREQRTQVVEQFRLDPTDFQYRHEETVGALEAGRMTLDEYLDVTVRSADPDVPIDEFRRAMFAQSQPWPASIEVARELANAGTARMATLNNEGEELNVYRLRLFGLREIFPTFFTSCWLGARKPMREIYHRVVCMTQADPKRTLFIDDRLQNLTPAAALGMKTIHFRSTESLRTELRDLGLIS